MKYRLMPVILLLLLCSCAKNYQPLNLKIKDNYIQNPIEDFPRIQYLLKGELVVRGETSHTSKNVSDELGMNEKKTIDEYIVVDETFGVCTDVYLDHIYIKFDKNLPSIPFFYDKSSDLYIMGGKYIQNDVLEFENDKYVVSENMTNSRTYLMIVEKDIYETIYLKGLTTDQFNGEKK
jgi:hypothetical protein